MQARRPGDRRRPACCRRRSWRGWSPRRRGRAISGWLQWWPARTATFSPSRIAATSCGWMSPSVKEITPLALRRIGRAEERQTRAPRPAAPGRSRAAPARGRGRASMPSPVRYSTATPRPIASPTAGVPASNWAGTSAQVERSSVDLADHAAAAHEGRHRLEQRALAVEHAGAHRAEHLVAGEGEEVDSRAPARRPAGAARSGRRRPAPPRRPHAPCAVIVGDVVDRAEAVGDVGDGDQLRLAASAARRRRSMSSRWSAVSGIVVDARRPSPRPAAARARGWSGAPSR